MNQNIKYLVENIFDDFYAGDEQSDIIDDFLKQGRIYFPKDKDELKAVIQEHYKNNIFNLNDIDVSLITDFSKLFEDDRKTGNEEFDISTWDVSNGEDFNHMFDGCSRFNCDLSTWDVRKGKKFYNMFFCCDEFNSDLSKWDVSSGEDFECMFYMCKNFNSDLSGWDVSNGKDFKSMFVNCYNFNSDLSKWNVGKGEYFINMFAGCKKFNSDLSEWDISDYVIRNYIDVDGMFKGCERLNNKYIPKKFNNDKMFSKIIYE